MNKIHYGLYTTCKSYLPPLPRPPKFCITFVFYFSWVRLGATAVPREIGNNACAHFFGGGGVGVGGWGGGADKMHHGLRLSHKATFRQLLRFFSVLRLFFPFFSTFFSFRKRSQLKSTGLNYCVSVWTPRLAQLPMPAWCCTPVHEVSGNT